MIDKRLKYESNKRGLNLEMAKIGAGLQQVMKKGKAERPSVQKGLLERGFIEPAKSKPYKLTRRGRIAKRLFGI